MSKKNRHKLKKNGQNKEFNWSNLLMFLSIGGLVLFLVWIVVKPNSANIDTSAWVKGNSDSKIVVAEYSDFQCPACKRYAPIFEQVIDKYQNQVRFEFHHFPLISIHSNAIAGAKAAEAAGKQGKFWQMHDYLYAHQSDWENRGNLDAVFADYAKTLGLDVEKFKTDYKDKNILRKINKQRSKALAMGLRGTPTIRINNKTIKTPTSVAEFSKILDNLLGLDKTASDSAKNLQDK